MDAFTINRIKRSYDLFNETGEFDHDLFRDNVEWRNAPELPGATLHRGREAVGADLAAQDEACEWRRAEPVELIPAGDKVVVMVSMSARGRPAAHRSCSRSCTSGHSSAAK
jgi:ketosteroid isomerase-like protein